MNMAEYGGRLQRIGLSNLEAMADLENRRIWDQLEQNNLESEAKNAAVGSLVGTVGGLGLAVMQEKDRDPKAMANAPGGEQSIAKASAESVSPGKVLGADSVLTSRSAAEKPGSGLGAASIRRSLDEEAMPDILKDRSIVAMKSPRRRHLASTYADTSDDFKIAFGDLLDAYPTNFIGYQP